MRLDKVKLTNLTAKHAGVTYATAKPVVDMLFKVMAEELRQGNSIHIKDFCNFEVVERPAREIMDFETGGKYMLPPIKVVKATPGAPLKRLIKNAE